MAKLKPFTPITAQQIAAKGVAALGDRPNTRQQYGAGGLSAIELKLWFDQLATLIAARVTEIQKALHEGDGDYISLNADADIVTLSDLTSAIFNGKLAAKLKVGTAFGIAGASLDSMINKIEKTVSVNSEDIEKNISDIRISLDTTKRTLTLTLLNKDGTTLDTLDIDLTTTTERIADGAVTMPKIAHKSLSTDAFADQSISTRTLQPNAVTEDKLSLELLLKLANLKKGAVNGVRYDAASNKIIITNEAGVTFEAELNIDGANIGADPIGTAQKKVAEHNADTSAHADIRALIAGLSQRLSAIADSDDNTLDQLSEIVTFIKSNKNLIDNITTAKINYSDIVNDLVTNDAKKPLSAAQGVAIKKLIDELDKNKVGANELAAELDRVLEEAKEGGEFDGESISISEVEESTESGGISVITFSDGTKMQVRNGFTPYIGDNGNWFIGNVDTTILSRGKDGKPAYAYAQEGGYTGTETAFAAKLAVPFIMPEMFGAKGDGVTDDSAAIQQAIQEAVNTATNAYYLKPVVYLSAKTYKIDIGLVLDSRCTQFYCDGIIEYSGSDAAVSVMHSLMNIYINQIKAPNGIGLYLTGAEHQCVANTIKINRIEESVKGVHFRNYGEANSMFYNELDIGSVNSTDKCVELSAELGYINENHFWFGKLSGGVNGIKIYSHPTASGTGASGNRFFKGSFEDLANTGENQDDSNTVALWLENTDSNTFDRFRCDENYGRMNVKFVGECSNNDIGLSTVQLGGVNTTELTAGINNVLRGAIYTGSVLGGGYQCGDKAIISYAHGITYDPSYANLWYNISSSSFANNIIKQVKGDTGDSLEIVTSFTFDDTANGMEFTLGSLYSENGSLCRGFPLIFKFNSTDGRILLKDSRGGTIFDNTDGKYSSISISVRWNGYDKVLEKNIWDIQKLGVDRETVDNKTTELSIFSTDKQYPTAKCVYKALKANEPEKLTFSVVDGKLVIASDVRYTNLVPVSIDTDGSVYKSVGYEDGYRINSSGNQVAQSGTAITGYMDCEGIADADTIFVKGLALDDLLYCGIAFYDENFAILQCLRLNEDGTLIGINETHGIIYPDSSSVSTDDSGIIAIKINFYEYNYDLTPPKYFRIFAKGNGSDAIVTISDEITENEQISVDLGIPTKTSELKNDSGFLTEHQSLDGYAKESNAETWTFTLEDGSIVTKKVVLA